METGVANMSLDEKKTRLVKKLRDEGKTFREIAQEAKVNFTQISEVLKGQPDPIESEVSSLHPFLVQLMRSSGEKTIKDAVISSINLHTSFNRVSLDRGFETTQDYISFTDERALSLEKDKRYLKEVLDTWMWTTDEELAALIGINSQVMRRFNRAKLIDRRRRLVGFLNYVILSYFRLLKQVGLRDDAVQ